MLARYPLVFYFIIAYAGNAFFVERLFLAPIAASNLPLTIGLGVLTLLLIVFTRGRLGYDRYLREAEGEPELATDRA